MSATKKYLDYDGLVQVWGKIKDNFGPNRLASASTSGMVYTTSTVQTGLTTTNKYYPTPIKDGIVYYQDSQTTYSGHYKPDSYGDVINGDGPMPYYSAGTGTDDYEVLKTITVILDGKGHVGTVSGTTKTIPIASVIGNGQSGTDGLMSWEDKAKLNTISLSATSGTTLAGHYTPSFDNTGARVENHSYYAYSAGTSNQFIKDITLWMDKKGHTVNFSGNTGGEAQYAEDGDDPSSYSGTSGLMGWEDKLKLDGISPGASSGTTYSGHYTPATAATDTNISGSTSTSPSNITTGTTLITSVNIRKDAKGHIVSFSQTTSSIPKASYTYFGLVKSGVNVTSTNGLQAIPVINGVPYHHAPTGSTTVQGNVSAATSGDVVCDLVLSSDTQGHITSISYKKLEGVSSGAQKNVIESITVGSTTFGPTGVTNKAIDITSAVNGLINTKVSSAVTPKGTKTFAQLTAITMSVDTLGDMYNVSDAFTINSQFKEYDSEHPKSYPAGTNVVCVEDGTSVYKWDVMAGFVDLSAYLLADDVSGLTESEINAICT
jgi:hypothetical protein